MLGRLVRGALAAAAQQAHSCEQLIAGRALVAELGIPAASHGDYPTTIYSSASQDAGAQPLIGVDGSRAGSHLHASTSSSAWSSSSPVSAPSSLPHGLQLQQLRCFAYGPPKRRFQLPKPIAQLVRDKILEQRRAAPAPPPQPTLEKRPLTDTSLRVGCIATKAGMTQEWDEHGVRVPLTVLWIDECQVVGVKTQQQHGRYALMLGAGHKRQKCMSPSEAGFFLKAGLPFKKLLAEWPVSEDALLPVGTHISAAHYVAGQRVDVTGWTKYKGFQGVMKRWGFKGQPASHGVSLSHRAPGAIGNRQDPGKVWKGKKLPGCMGDERRTVHHCLVYKVDAARNLVYVRGQVPGPKGRSVYLRDSRLSKPRVRATWGLPFPTHIRSPEELAAAAAPGDVSALPDPAAVSVWRNPTDPYLMYTKETDYFPITWKKGD
ncbi:54S ribosomal protein L3 [Pleodorina starrii]|uniref:Large ribosomal subunit protein uL3m n=1 Tax=Pleodorina starrii TaxID=330485 RepID=A0A9W6F620_9CHLO|nr:54S ribosomal protein L3 [Pleodorina starrii]GLC64862.1 54S ribosomal protein L3 [Pleodorina starrii]